MVFQVFKMALTTFLTQLVYILIVDLYKAAIRGKMFFFFCFFFFGTFSQNVLYIFEIVTFFLT